MKRVMCSVGLMAAIALAGINVFFVVQDGNDLVRVKDAQANASSRGVEECDPLKYVRDATESWETVEVINGYITVNGENRYVGNVTGTYENKYVRVPVCSLSKDRCCEKSHKDKGISFI